jgi:DNA repair exonuclease SbcCD nuclease subunit
MAYKFIQISDVGFNHSLSTDVHINKYIEKVRRETFQKVIDLCIKEKVTALLVCGNLYNENSISYENARLIKKGFARLKANDIAIVYAHGNIDSGYFLDSIENEVIEIKSRYTKYVYSLPFDIDTINFIGIGHSKRMVFIDEYLEEKFDNLSIGLMYIDRDIYTNQTLELLHRRMEKSKVNYWAVGGSKTFIERAEGSNYCYSGHLCPMQGDISGCVLITISNKMKITSKPIDLCSDAYKYIHIKDPYNSKDIYHLLERCSDLIQKSKVPEHNMIVGLEISGPCTCYDQLVKHKNELQNEIARITDTNLFINISNLTKQVMPDIEVEDETHVTELLEECIKLYDDEELYSRTIEKLKSKRVFYNKDKALVDKRKILEGVDSILVESAVKEDGHDN